MIDLTVTKQFETTLQAYKIKLFLAFFAITSCGAQRFSPSALQLRNCRLLFAAGTRFFIAGTLLFGFMCIKGETRPSAVQWRNLLVMSLLMS